MPAGTDTAPPVTATRSRPGSRNAPPNGCLFRDPELTLTKHAVGMHVRYTPPLAVPRSGRSNHLSKASVSAPARPSPPLLPPTPLWPAEPCSPIPGHDSDALCSAGKATPGAATEPVRQYCLEDRPLQHRTLRLPRNATHRLPSQGRRVVSVRWFLRSRCAPSPPTSPMTSADSRSPAR